MREIYTFYYKAETQTGHEKFRAVSPEDAYSKFINWAEDNGLYILDFDTETQEIEEEREI